SVNDAQTSDDKANHGEVAAFALEDDRTVMGVRALEDELRLQRGQFPKVDDAVELAKNHLSLGAGQAIRTADEERVTPQDSCLDHRVIFRPNYRRSFIAERAGDGDARHIGEDCAVELTATAALV